jgi:single-strand DNA-binding protein
MLRVELIGNLGGAAEQRFTQQGRAMTQLRVAVNQRRQRPDGEPEETTTWFGVRAMGTLGERCATLDKGTRVLVVGRLDIRHYQRQDGTPAVAYDVWADEVLNLSPRAEADGEAGSTEPSTARPPTTAVSGTPHSRQTGPAEPVEELEDLPF